MSQLWFAILSGVFIDEVIVVTVIAFISSSSLCRVALCPRNGLKKSGVSPSVHFPSWDRVGLAFELREKAKETHATPTMDFDSSSSAHHTPFSIVVETHQYTTKDLVYLHQASIHNSRIGQSRKNGFREGTSPVLSQPSNTIETMFLVENPFFVITGDHDDTEFYYL